MNRVWVFAALSLVVLAPVGLRGDAEEDRKKVEGTWRPTSAELAGQPFPAEILKSMRLTLADGKYTLKSSEQTDQGTVALGTAGELKTMDIKGTEGPNKGRTILAIYEMGGDTLKICYDLSGAKRPTEFRTAAKTKLFLVTYKRDKP